MLSRNQFVIYIHENFSFPILVYLFRSDSEQTKLQPLLRLLMLKSRALQKRDLSGGRSGTPCHQWPFIQGCSFSIHWLSTSKSPAWEEGKSLMRQNVPSTLNSLTSSFRFIRNWVKRKGPVTFNPKLTRHLYLCGKNIHLPTRLPSSLSKSFVSAFLFTQL